MKVHLSRLSPGRTVIGGVAVLAVAVLVDVVPPASAVQGQPVIAGGDNTATSTTLVYTASSCTWMISTALAACGPGRGLQGEGAIAGVEGRTDTGSGVVGINFGTTGIGVEGRTSGVGSGVYGLAQNSGVGVYGDSANGTGVQARSTGTGTALNVIGKAKFSRSGVVTVPAGATSRAVTMAGVTTASMVMALSQQNSTVFVRAAVPAAGTFTIRLSAAAPAGGLKVAYFVLS